MLSPRTLLAKTMPWSFMRYRIPAFFFSAALILLTIALFVGKGPNWGIDFTGGIVMEIRTNAPADLTPMRSALGALNVGEVALQHFGDVREVLIRIQVAEGMEQPVVIRQVKDALEGLNIGEIDYRKTDYVGPSVGAELVESGAIALIVAFILVMMYVWIRFEWQFGLGAVVALIHDAIFVVGFYVVAGFDVGLPAIAALLTVIGYSINDSVVIYDRIRENMRKYKQRSLTELIDQSLNETLSRTLMTAITTLLAAGALVVFGGEVLRGFSAALMVGVIVGTYSSIYIAAPVLIYLNASSLGEELPERA